MADSDDDDLTFAKDYRPTEEGMVISAKDADFRSFLCDSGAAEEMIRLLVGLAESSNPPADPVAFLRAKFDAEDMPDMVVGKVREDIPALLRENDARTQQVAQLTAQVDEAVAKLEEREAAAHAVLVDQLIGGGAYASDATEGALDLAKLYAAVLARFPAPPEPAEGEERGGAAAAPAVGCRGRRLTRGHAHLRRPQGVGQGRLWLRRCPSSEPRGERPLAAAARLRCLGGRGDGGGRAESRGAIRGGRNACNLHGGGQRAAAGGGMMTRVLARSFRIPYRAAVGGLQRGSQLACDLSLYRVT